MMEQINVFFLDHVFKFVVLVIWHFLMKRWAVLADGLPMLLTLGTAIVQISYQMYFKNAETYYMAPVLMLFFLTVETYALTAIFT